ncbi:uncharacterized protein N7477_001459 [Penicillium maclennaniae]|uniref:uncharacterized protein n=1 Tax=Penicillium maclennaniae TaxID=1343394 RepID=UPI00253F851F|nr:uncharacterized protein N7477_001459 [Penicillium maclennaniae]KAJ5681519.1 hypothetical protein N7477_001459 [Penicillium maclennaniae]
MARTDSHYAREPVFQVSKGRMSRDSTSSLRYIKEMRSATQAGTEGRWTSENSGPALSPLEADASHEPSLFSESSEPIQAPEDRRGPVRSKTTPNMTSSEPSWTVESTHLMSPTELDESPDGHDHGSQKSKHIKPKVHLKPMLRKMSRDEAPSTSIDLSRSSTEQEGLGIYMNLDRDRRPSDSLTGVAFRRTPSGFHNRSTSGTSQFSSGTTSSGSRRGSQYVHPLRPTPRAYTPPLSQSYQTPENENEQENESPEVESRTLASLETHRPTRAASGPVPRLSLQIESDVLIQGIPNLSQTNVAGRPSFGYARDNGSTLDTASPISRSSLDFVFRSRTRTSTDPVSRAAAIQAARQAFEEKEAAKARRLEKQQNKAEDKQIWRRVKRKQSDGPESPPIQPNEILSEKSSPSKETKRPGVRDQQRPTSWKSQSKNTWMLFMTWLRTRIFKIRRKLRKTS